jgi:rSAM/selenodomain-associated transferase 2
LSSISVIIPVFNEERILGGLLETIEREHPLEILVADGGSSDGTARMSSPAARVIPCPRGRAIQMNTAARSARGSVLLFLHADVRPEPGALQAIEKALHDPAIVGGNLDIVYEGADRVAKIFSWINRQRYRFGIFYGDSGIFCRRAAFESLGGFPDWPILEDYAFARKLVRFGKLAFLPHRIHVSARRWREAGLFATLWAWFWIQALYLAGVHPTRLAKMYKDIR